MSKCKMSKDYLDGASINVPGAYDGDRDAVNGDRCSTCNQPIKDHKYMEMMCPYISIKPDIRDFNQGICRVCSFGVICHMLIRDPISALRFHFFGHALKEKKEDKYKEKISEQKSIAITHNEDIIPSHAHKFKRLGDELEVNKNIAPRVLRPPLETSEEEYS